MKYTCHYDFPVGTLYIVEQDNAISQVSFEKIEGIIQKETELIRQCKEQLDQYFLKQRKEFDLPLNPKGTEFQKKCYDALCSIPYGKTITYKQEATLIGNPKACRAVGMANHQNPIVIIIPCHRVIGSNKKLVGYGGGLDIKEYLLNLEKDA